MRTYSNENDFDLHENGREGGTHFHTNDFARRLVLKQRQRVTRKWPINSKVLCPQSPSFISCQGGPGRLREAKSALETRNIVCDQCK